ncbi:MAG: glycoside hydrolase family 57 protein [Candidatus Bipolaricaulia bacterium]
MTDHIFVSFLWHMHQPYYRLPGSQETPLPWVRLHGTKSYYDMARILQDHPHARGNFNLVPSLLNQLELYQQRQLTDRYLKISKKRPEELDPEEKRFLLQNFFDTNWKRNIDPYPGYRRLLDKRNNAVNPDIEAFSDQEYLDLIVWFNLAWLGETVRGTDHEIEELLKKGTQFTTAERDYVLETQFRILEQVIPLYQTLDETDQAELSTTPFYHPILPLIIDTGIARRAQPKIDLPKRFSFSEDAEYQVHSALEYHENLLGNRPKGMWPAEGAVSPEIVPILAWNGVRWIATDEEILMHSVSVKPKDELAELHYRPYRYAVGGDEITILFRDAELSNRISFSYHQWPAEQAAENLVSYLTEIGKAWSENRPPLVLIALDGENPWEHYERNGKPFLDALYTKLVEAQEVEMTTIDRYLDAFAPDRALESLHSGSWNSADFRIWIGDPEHTQAWELLRKTREAVAASGDQERVEQALPYLYITEGSDWFWWYSRTYNSKDDPVFDWLFRENLKAAYRALGATPPAELGRSIL